MQQFCVYFHIRFELSKPISPSGYSAHLLHYYRIGERDWVKAVSVDDKGTPFDVALLSDVSVEEVWRLIGEQAEWLLHMLDSFKDTVAIPASHIRGFLNHFIDITAMPMRHIL